jgi:hypothetical protein
MVPSQLLRLAAVAPAPDRSGPLLPPFSSALPVTCQVGRRQGGAHPGPRLRLRLALNRHLSETPTQVVYDALQKDGVNSTIIPQHPARPVHHADASVMDLRRYRGVHATPIIRATAGIR